MNTERMSLTYTLSKKINTDLTTYFALGGDSASSS